MVAPSSLLARRADLSDAKRALLDKLLADAAAPAGALAIPRRAAAVPVPLSFSQQSLWFFHQLDPQSPLYHLPLALRLAGRLDPVALQRALDAIVVRHEIFRTRYVVVDESPRQEVDTPFAVTVRRVDFSTRPLVEHASAVRVLIDEECRRPFNLARDPLLRGLLVQTTASEHTLVLTTHHIAADGWSWVIFFRELVAGYAHASAATAPAPAALPLHYGDFALWQRQRLTGDTLHRELADWRAQLAGAPLLLELPTDRPRPTIQTFRGAWEKRELSSRLTADLRAFSQSENATLFVTLLAAFNVLLHRCSGQTDLIIGTAVAGRTHVQLEELIGCFVNTLPLRSNLTDDPTFRELVAQVRATSLAAFTHQELPFENLVAGLGPPRSPAYPPIVQVMFTLQDERVAPAPLAGLIVTRLATTTDTAKFDLSLMISDTGAALIAILEYNSDLFDAATAQRWLGHFETLLEGLVVNPARRVSEPPLLTAAERSQLLQTWNATATDYPRDATIPDLFARQVALQPGAVAIECGPERVTYQELNDSADALARRLRLLGVGPDVPVALCLERSVTALVALLGILKSGGAYAALDPGYPAERLALMLGELRAPVVLTHTSLVAKLPASAAQVICLDEGEPMDPNPLSFSVSATAPTADHLAYISFTSGSTGRPKGVCIPHRGVVRLVCQTNYATFAATDVFLQFAPLGFDASTFEIWGALLNGARLVIHPPGTPSLAELGAFIVAQRVTTLWLTAGLFHALVDHSLPALRHVRQLLAGGDTLSPAHVRQVLAAHPSCRLINGYGPTENTTFSCCHTATHADTAIPIGRPIANSEAYILDARLQPNPIGVPGELWVGGDGLARGYLNQPDLTAEKFAPHPFKPGARLYRTGDRARFLPDGTIAFLGRSDRQVKIRGFRVELGEIEAQLERAPTVRACAVTAPADATGERRLVAHVVSTDSAPSAGVLRAFLRQTLPAHLVPAGFVFLSALPLTPNGKIDHRALLALAPAPGPDLPAPASATPADPWEEKLLTLWETLLGIAPIKVTDRFFDLGGHSLLAIRLVAMIEKTFGRRLPVATVFAAQSIAQLAAILREERVPAAGGSLLAIQPLGRQAPLYLVHGVGGGMLWGYINLARHLGTDQPVYVFRANWATGEIRRESIEQMAARYVTELRAFQPAGPYSLGGYCFGGNVAYEMARLLEAQGQAVATLALMNCSPPNSAYYRFRWTPLGLARFGLNLGRSACAVFGWDRQVRAHYLRWRLDQIKGRATRLLRRARGARPATQPAEIVNLDGLPEEQRALYEAHLHALIQYRCQPYGGSVTLFRTRGHPLVSSFDAQYGWGEFVRGPINLRRIPGGHDSLLQEPHVQAVARVLLAGS